MQRDKYDIQIQVTEGQYYITGPSHTGLDDIDVRPESGWVSMCGGDYYDTQRAAIEAAKVCICEVGDSPCKAKSQIRVARLVEHVEWSSELIDTSVDANAEV